MSISSFPQGKKTKVSYKHPSGLIKTIMPAHLIDLTIHWPSKNVRKQELKLQVREPDHL